jgi:hypothetical protein
MKEDIGKFRTLALALLKSGKLTKADIIRVMNISDPTYKRLLYEDINTIKIQASILAKAQDFCKTYAVYQGIDADGNSVEETSQTTIGIKKKDKDKADQKDLDDALAKAREILEDEPPKAFDKEFWTLIREIEKKLPRNMSIAITINSKK